MRNGIYSALEEMQFGHYKIVSRTPGKIGCVVEMRNCLRDARKAAQAAKNNGYEVTVSRRVMDKWESVETE